MLSSLGLYVKQHEEWQKMMYMLRNGGQNGIILSAVSGFIQNVGFYLTCINRFLPPMI